MALARALMISGAMASILDLGTSYALERNQFGRAIAKFQAVQQQLAVLAGEAAAAIRAADGALEALGTADELVEIAVAKARAGEAAGRGAEIAHQVHGAMGFTHEHRLHHRTRRLWAWRDDYGHEAHWQAWLGRRIAGVGADGLWGFVSGRS
jgi:alkylation response protein AidB-like acyl-CoA dehydrogenase